MSNATTTPVARNMPSTTTIVTGIVALFVVGAALIVGLSVTGAGEKSTPLLTAMISVLAPTIVALVGLLRADQAKAVALQSQATTQDNYDSLHNGLLAAKVTEGVERANREQVVMAEQNEILTLLRRIGIQTESEKSAVNVVDIPLGGIVTDPTVDKPTIKIPDVTPATIEKGVV